MTRGQTLPTNRPDQKNSMRCRLRLLPRPLGKASLVRSCLAASCGKLLLWNLVFPLEGTPGASHFCSDRMSQLDGGQLCLLSLPTCTSELDDAFASSSPLSRFSGPHVHVLVAMSLLLMDCEGGHIGGLRRARRASQSRTQAEDTVDKAQHDDLSSPFSLGPGPIAACQQSS